MGLRDGQRDLHTIHASIMLPAKCHKATVICLLSLHTFRTTHTHTHTQYQQQPLLARVSVCACVCACLAYCRQCRRRRRCVSFAISKHLGTEFPKLASSTLNYQQISLSPPLFHPFLLPCSPFRFRPSTHPCLSCLLLLLLISATFTWLT